tara:strand:+ start:490 stop:1323 length:834 start_codon:yes stop_codon:yes gene_type:complete
MHVVLNQFVIYVSLPGLALYYIPKIEISTALLYPLGVAWLGFGLSFLFFYTLGKYLGWSKKLTGCLILTAGLGNTSFVGFPVIEALYGSKGIETAIVIDQPGTFVVMATFGIIVATLFSREKLSANAIVKKILFFPPFIAFAIAVLLNVFNVDFPVDFQSVFQRIGSTVTPIALIAVGLQLKIERNSKHWGFLTLGLLFKLMITPLFFFILYKKIFGASGLMIDVSIVESAMAPMITGAILASTYGLKPKLSSMMVGIGIPLSFVTLAFWYWILLNF